MNRSTHWGRRSVAGLALAMVVAACSSAPGAATPNASPGTTTPPGATAPAASTPPAASVGTGGAVLTEMCPLISGTDVATIVGMDLAETKPEGNWCTWTFTERRSGAIPGIGGTVIVRYENDDTTLTLSKGAFPGGEDVSIGDRAYWADDVSVLYVVKGGHVYAVQLILFDKAEPRKDMALAVAQLLLARL